MARGALNVLPAAQAWFHHEGRERWPFYFGIPVVSGVAVWLLGLQYDDLGSLQAGAIFFAGAMMTVLFKVFEWSRDAASALDADELRRDLLDPFEAARYGRRMRAVERTYRSVVWGCLIALLNVVALVVLNTKSASGQDLVDNTVGTALVTVLAVHLLLIVVSVVNRVFIVTSSDVERDKDRVLARRDEVPEDASAVLTARHAEGSVRRRGSGR